MSGLSFDLLGSGNNSAPDFVTRPETRRFAEADFYTLTGQADDVITLALVETSNWGLASNDARLTLFAPSGAQVITFDSNGQQEVTLPESGTYVVRVQANNLVSTGSYDLELECL